MPLESSINLSIVIPVYNENIFILRLFKELKNYFNFSNVEIIIVDDGSTDHSLETIKNFKKINYC